MPVKVVTLPQAPDWIRPFVRGAEFFWLHDTCYRYALVDAVAFRAVYADAPEKFALNLDGFVAISDGIEPQDRPLAAYHETLEFEGALDECACVRTLEKELDAAKYFAFYRDGFDRYLKRRFEFFEGIVSYYEAMKKRTPQDDALLARLYRSKAYLAACIETITAAST